MPHKYKTKEFPVERVREQFDYDYATDVHGDTKQIVGSHTFSEILEMIRAKAVFGTGTQRQAIAHHLRLMITEVENM